MLPELSMSSKGCLEGCSKRCVPPLSPQYPYQQFMRFHMFVYNPLLRGERQAVPLAERLQWPHSLALAILAALPTKDSTRLFLLSKNEKVASFKLKFTWLTSFQMKLKCKSLKIVSLTVRKWRLKCFPIQLLCTDQMSFFWGWLYHRPEKYRLFLTLIKMSSCIDCQKWLKSKREQANFLLKSANSWAHSANKNPQISELF